MPLKRSPIGNPLRAPSNDACSFYASDPAINSSLLEDDSQSKNTYITKRLKRKCDDSSEVYSPQSDLKSMLKELAASQDKKFDILLKQNDEVKESIEFMSTKFDEMLLRMSSLEKENSALKKHNKELEQRINLLEKNSRQSMIEIRNIPAQEKESKLSTLKLVQNIGVSLSLDPPLQFSDFREVYRTKSSAIIVEFNSTMKKDDFITKLVHFNKCKKEAKLPLLNTEHINLPGTPKSIFISDVLTTKARRLFYLSRELLKNKKIVATWTSHGKVFIKREENQPPIRVNEEEDLNYLK